MELLSQRMVFSLSASELAALGEGAEAVEEMLADPEIQAQIQEFLGEGSYEVVVHQVTKDDSLRSFHEDAESGSRNWGQSRDYPPVECPWTERLSWGL